MKPGYSRDGEQVVLAVTLDDFQTLLLCLGIATGAMSGPNAFPRGLLALANRINAGNPNWTPYDLTPPASTPA